MESSNEWGEDQGVMKSETLLNKIRSILPAISLRSSLIVGFPGEGERQFKALLDFVEEIRFDHLGAFKYSSEEGTPASRLPNQIPEDVKEERLGILMELQKKISLKKNQERIGSRVEVLVEGSDHPRDQRDIKRQAPNPGP